MTFNFLSYQIVPNIILIVAILGIVLIILRHLPEAIAQDQAKQGNHAEVVEKLSQKGLPAMAISKLRSGATIWKNKTWNFLLETKDLKPTSVAGYRIKQIFGKQAAGLPPVAAAPQHTTTQDVRTEKYFLDEIKKDPKNLHLYADLGKYYLDRAELSDAKDIYQYLTQHNPANGEYFARLAQCYFRLKDYARAVENYDKSLALDSTQPNRFYNKGVSLEALGKYPEAIESFEKAIRLESKNPKFFMALGNIFTKLGNRNLAKVSYRNARKLDPANQDVAEKLKTL